MKTLVIIDDEIFFRKSLINFLEKQNIYNIAGEANNGQAGIQLIENVKPDIALVDISMPVMSGLDMIAALGTDCHTRFILSTGYEDFDYAKKAISLQVRGYLLKPLDHRELMETLQKVSDEIDQENSRNSYVNNYFQFRDLYTRQMQLNFFQKVISGTTISPDDLEKFRFIKLPVILPFLWRSTVPIRKYGMKKVIFLCSTPSWKIYAEKSYSLCAKSLFTLTILR
ncbi:response regulator [Blautia massiliensis (ex Durand et al. 2017)]|uniref:response regulator n=1 Tax=Blautia massiliensis (ex Durand et al. 2017) TaxID=1737424 RepID=UPI00241E7F46|nr:response regulator [Blautia massiliensis (ex Durand et al. 2017)]